MPELDICYIKRLLEKALEEVAMGDPEKAHILIELALDEFVQC